MVRKLSVYETKNTNPYKNLAIEEFLTFHVEPSECILFLWQNRQTVVIGKNQNAWKECKVRQLEEEGGHLVRRLSGGGAVFHDLGNLNFTFCVREEDYDVVRQTEVILQAVKSLGINAEKNGRNDITADGRKFSGHAYYKSQGFCYHHGTLLVDVDQARMAKYLNVSAAKLKSKGVDSVRSRTVNLKELQPDLTIDRMKEALIQAFGSVYDSAEENTSVIGNQEGRIAGQFADGAELKRELLISNGNEKEFCGKHIGHIGYISEKRLDWAWIAEAEQRFDSWEWKYGRKILFNVSLEERFSWGIIEIQLHISGGRIWEIQVYSDAMEEQLPERLKEIWCNCEYRLESMLARLDGLKLNVERGSARETCDFEKTAALEAEHEVDIESKIKADIRKLLVQQL